MDGWMDGWWDYSRRGLAPPPQPNLYGRPAIHYHHSHNPLGREIQPKQVNTRLRLRVRIESLVFLSSSGPLPC